MHLGFSPPEDLTWCEEGCRTAGIGCIECKMRLADNMVRELAPIRDRYNRYRADPNYVEDVTRHGAAVCRERAAQTMDEVRRKVGIR
jgi:tryptophanyl-tRNA synthetase